MPTWRKTVIVCAIASTCVIGAAVTTGELHFFLSAATTPNGTTGEVFSRARVAQVPQISHCHQL